jgi:drug/metabolite transporter (DMT)-like permease
VSYPLAVLGALAAAVCYGAASVLQSIAARRSAVPSGLDARLLLRLLGQAPYLAGLVLDLLGFLASIAALRKLPLFFVQAAIASSVGVTVALAVVFLGVRLQRRESMALAALGAGLLLLALAARSEQAHPLARSGEWVLLAGVLAVLMVGVVFARPRARGGAAGLAIGAGLGFSGVGVAARALVVPDQLWRLVTEPLAWAVVAYGVSATLLFASALQRGSVTTATALTFAVETVVPAAVGLAWLGDRPRPGFAVVAAAGFVVTMTGALALAHFGGGVSARPAPAEGG